METTGHCNQGNLKWIHESFIWSSFLGQQSKQEMALVQSICYFFCFQKDPKKGNIGSHFVYKFSSWIFDLKQFLGPTKGGTQKLPILKGTNYTWNPTVSATRVIWQWNRKWSSSSHCLMFKKIQKGKALAHIFLYKCSSWIFLGPQRGKPTQFFEGYQLCMEPTGHCN